MAKRKSTPPGNGSAQPAEPVVADRVLIGLGTLKRDERRAITRVITSSAQLRKLAKTADVAGTGGRFRVADVLPDLRLVFQVSEEGVNVIDLVSKNMVAPPRRMTGKTMSGKSGRAKTAAKPKV